MFVLLQLGTQCLRVSLICVTFETYMYDREMPMSSVLFCSVHFEHDDEAGDVPHPGDDLDLGNDTRVAAIHVTDPEWSELNDKQQRNMDQWCFAENFEPAVFLQVRLSSWCIRL